MVPTATTNLDPPNSYYSYHLTPDMDAAARQRVKYYWPKGITDKNKITSIKAYKYVVNGAAQKN